MSEETQGEEVWESKEERQRETAKYQLTNKGTLSNLSVIKAGRDNNIRTTSAYRMI